MMRALGLLFVCFFLQTGLSQEIAEVKNQKDLLMTSHNCIEAGIYAVWLGSDKGINRVEIERDSILEVSSRQTTKPVLSICEDNKFLWVGISEKGLYLFNKTTYIFKGKFKKEIGKKNIVVIKKEGKKLHLRSDKNEAFIVDLTDTSIQESATLHSILKEPTKKTRFKEHVYILSPQGELQTQLNGTKKILGREKDSADHSDSIVNDKKKELVIESLPGEIEKLPVEDSNTSVVKSQELCDSQSSSYVWILIPILLLYSVVLVKLFSRKYKRDIKVLEDELLKTKK